MIPNAPWSKPAAPTPATARPTIKAREVGAEAQTVEPTKDLSFKSQGYE